jgi:hypothetical protein
MWFLQKDLENLVLELELDSEGIAPGLDDMGVKSRKVFKQL